MSELRYDPIQGRWVIIATDRSRRPHDLLVNARSARKVRFCPFCPGNEARTPPEIVALSGPKPAGGGDRGWQVRIVPNKYPALSVEGNLERSGKGLYDYMRGVGAHEVVIDSPDHDADFASLPVDHLAMLLAAYQDRQRDLYRDRRLQYVLVFKNHGAEAGATLPHPHSQIIATPIIPRTVVVELQQAQTHYRQKRRCLFCDVVNEELDRNERIVRATEHFVVFAPYASRFPFELMIIPRRHDHLMTSASQVAMKDLAACLHDACRRIKQLLDDPAYNIVFHTSPNTQAFDTPGHYWQTLKEDYHWHVEILPRLTRIAGFENGTDFYINPTAPESAAHYLRELSGGD